jgi:hypothetical protein
LAELRVEFRLGRWPIELGLVVPFSVIISLPFSADQVIVVIAGFGADLSRAP